MNHASFKTRLHLSDWLISLGLFVGTIGILMSTMNVGFPRDEGFYFRFGAIYQGWLQDVASGEEGVLEEEEVERIWKNNREHPPLAKVLFGLSWGNLAEKRRPISRVERSRGQKGDWIHVVGLRKGEGFDEDTSLLILRPRYGEDDSRASLDRVIGRAHVDAVRNGRVRARISDGPLHSKTFRELCGGRYGPKGAYSGCEAVVEEDLGKWSESTAFRFPTVVWMALLVATIYLFGVGTIGRWGALFAALALLFTPRHFYHAHLTTFDVPVMAMVFWLVVSFWLSLRNRAWMWVCGVLWGFALLTKLNAFFVPVVLGLWWLSQWRPGSWGGEKLGRLRLGSWTLPSFPGSFLSMPLLGIPLFILLWPRLWYNGWEHFLEYVGFHLKHDHYMQIYFGEILSYPPFPLSFPFGMSLFSLPIPILLLGLMGSVWVARRLWVARCDVGAGFSLEALLGIHALFPFVLIAMPSTPVFGGVKHWMTAMPFFMLIGGIAFQAMVDALCVRARMWMPVAATGLLGLCLASGVQTSLHVHPNGTAFYNGLIGGLPGAADAKMQRQFWGGQTIHGLDYLNEHVPRSGRVYFHKSPRGCWDIYRKEGLLRADIQHTADLHNFNKIEKELARTTHAVYHHQKSHDEYELAIWRAYGTEAPVWQHAVDGVPVLSIYENPAKMRRQRVRPSKKK